MHDNQCEGEYKMSVKTKEISLGDFKLKVTNFPIEICTECGDYRTNLSDGVKVELYAHEIAKKEHSNDVEVDFSAIEKEFKDKDIVNELMSRMQD